MAVPFGRPLLHCRPGGLSRDTLAQALLNNGGYFDMRLPSATDCVPTKRKSPVGQIPTQLPQ
jgi:hypothetical protein